MITDSVAPIFKSLVWDIMIKKAVADAIALLALSPTGFVAWLVSYFIIQLTNWLYPVFTKIVKVGEIQLNNEVHQVEYDRAKTKLTIIAHEKGIDSDEFKKQRDIHHDKLLSLVVYNI